MEWTSSRGYPAELHPEVEFADVDDRSFEALGTGQI
jgi:hypothetical protein